MSVGLALSTRGSCADQLRTLTHHPIVQISAVAPGCPLGLERPQARPQLCSGGPGRLQCPLQRVVWGPGSVPLEDSQWPVQWDTGRPVRSLILQVSTVTAGNCRDLPDATPSGGAGTSPPCGGSQNLRKNVPLRGPAEDQGFCRRSTVRTARLETCSPWGGEGPPGTFCCMVWNVFS